MARLRIKNSVKVLMIHDCDEHNSVRILERELRAAGIKTLNACDSTQNGYFELNEIDLLLKKVNIVCLFLTIKASKKPNVIIAYEHAKTQRKKIIMLIEGNVAPSYVNDDLRCIELDPVKPKLAARKLVQSILREQKAQTKKRIFQAIEILPLIASLSISIIYPVIGIPLVVESLFPFLKSVIDLKTL